MRQVYKVIGLVAVQDFRVVIAAESDTGEELVTRAIDEHANRASCPSPLGEETDHGANSGRTPGQHPLPGGYSVSTASWATASTR